MTDVVLERSPLFFCSRFDDLACLSPQHYEKNDQMLPGKKGISLTVEQYEVFKAAMHSGVIDKEIKALEK